MSFARKQLPDAHTATLGVVGHPVGHSLSPLLQNTLLRKLSLNACYHAFDVEPARFRDAIRGAASLGFLGLNVTVPHKQRAAELCDLLSDEARLLRAANTLVFRPDGSIFGANTDPFGFRRALQEFRPDLRDFNALVLGAGGAARSVVLALSQLGSRNVWIANRTRSRAQALVQELGPALGEATALHDLPLDSSNVQRAVDASQLVVNATSVGMAPDVDATPLPPGVRLNPAMAVVDLIYNPLETRFLREAKEAGCEIDNGLNMLIFQAVASLEIWFETEVNLEPNFLTELRTLLTGALSSE